MKGEIETREGGRGRGVLASMGEMTAMQFREPNLMLARLSRFGENFPAQNFQKVMPPLHSFSSSSLESIRWGMSANSR
jgi:hypothetical protein